jgi:hypothetical protein
MIYGFPCSSIAFWISIAPSIAFVTGRWSRSGLFSLNCGGAIRTPSIAVIPGVR